MTHMTGSYSGTGCGANCPRRDIHPQPAEICGHPANRGVRIRIGNPIHPGGTTEPTVAANLHRNSSGPGTNGRFDIAAQPLEPRFGVGELIAVSKVEQKQEPLARIGIGEATPQGDLGLRPVAADERVVTDGPHPLIGVVEPAKEIFLRDERLTIAGHRRRHESRRAHLGRGVGE